VGLILILLYLIPHLFCARYERRQPRSTCPHNTWASSAQKLKVFTLSHGKLIIAWVSSAVFEIVQLSRILV
jgi:hypothetical protein